MGSCKFYLYTFPARVMILRIPITNIFKDQKIINTKIILCCHQGGRPPRRWRGQRLDDTGAENRQSCFAHRQTPAGRAWGSSSRMRPSFTPGQSQGLPSEAPLGPEDAARRQAVAFGRSDTRLDAAVAMATAGLGAHH